MTTCYKCRKESKFTEWDASIGAPTCMFCFTGKTLHLKDLLDVIEQLTVKEIMVLEDVANDLLYLRETGE